jgi:hypothetical protein
MRWVDQKFKEWDHWDEQVLDEMESSKQDFKRAGSTGELARMAKSPTSADPLRFIATDTQIHNTIIVPSPGQ